MRQNAFRSDNSPSVCSIKNMLLSRATLHPYSRDPALNAIVVCFLADSNFFFFIIMKYNILPL